MDDNPERVSSLEAAAAVDADPVGWVFEWGMRDPVANITTITRNHIDVGMPIDLASRPIQIKQN